MFSLNSTKSVFVSITLLGIFSYLVAASFGIPTSALFLIPLAAMTIYCIIISLVPAKHRDVADADNAYYMGFIFTMTSLGFALFKIEPQGDNIATSKLIREFGIALSSTIWGIFLRIVISPKRQDIDSEEATARSLLQESVVGFSKVLNESGQLVKESYEQHVNKFTTAMTAVSNRIETDLNAFNTKLSKIFLDIHQILGKSLPDTLDKTNDSLTNICASIIQNSSKLQNAIDMQLVQIVKTNEIIKEKNQEFQTSFNNMNDAMQTLTRNLSKIEIDNAAVQLHIQSIFDIYKKGSSDVVACLSDSTALMKALFEELTYIPVKVDKYIDSQATEARRRDHEIKRLLDSISQSLSANSIFYDNLPSILDSNIRPVFQSIESQSSSLQSLNEIGPSISDVKTSLIAIVGDFKSQQSAVLSNIYSATYEILQRFDKFSKIKDSDENSGSNLKQ
jgi:hypothetical protein